MATDSLSFTADGAKVEITGLRSTLRDMQRMGAEAEELRGLMEQIGELVVSAARPLARRESGAMAGSIRAGRVKTRAVVRAGGARIPYAGVQHYGWARRNISPNPYLTNALVSRQSAVLAALDKGLAGIINGK